MIKGKAKTQSLWGLKRAIYDALVFWFGRDSVGIIRVGHYLVTWRGRQYSIIIEPEFHPGVELKNE